MGKAKVQPLRPREGTALDPVQLGVLMARMADKQGLVALGDQLDELALKLSQIGPAWRDARFDQVSRLSRDVADIAVALGVERLARVARTAVALSRQNDGVALAANLGRMMRLGEAVLTSVWELQDVLS